MKPFYIALLCTFLGGMAHSQAQTGSNPHEKGSNAKQPQRGLVLPNDGDSLSGSLRFHENAGQLQYANGNPVPQVRFYAANTYPAAYLMDDTLSYVFSAIDTDRTTLDTMQRVDMTFDGNGVSLNPNGQEDYYHNYYLGHIPEGRERVPFYKNLYKKQVWEKIDVSYSSNRRGLKYYFIVHPGGLPGAINLKYNGQDGLYVDGNGNLVIKTANLGGITQPRPIAYKMDAHGNLTSLGWQPSYQVTGNVVRLENVGNYDANTDLVIEVIQGYADKVTAAQPTWCTFHGDQADESCVDSDLDSGDSLFVTGFTWSPVFPRAGQNILQFWGSQEAYVGKFNPNYQMKWMTTYGGTAGDQSSAIAVDPKTNRVYMGGTTFSGTAPSMHNNSLPGSYMESYPTPLDYSAFLAAFDKSTGKWLWGTQFGGLYTAPFGMDVDTAGNLYVVGETWETNTVLTNQPSGGGFPICGPPGAYQQSVQNNCCGLRFGDGFIAKFSPQATLLWSTLFGGDHFEGFYDVAVDHVFGWVYAVGYSVSMNAGPTGCPSAASYMPLCDAGGFFQGTLDGGNAPQGDGLMVRFDLGGNLNWSTYVGGDGEDMITGVAVRRSAPSLLPNPNSDVYIVGSTTSTTYGPNGTVPQNGGFPHYATGPQYTQPFGGQTDAFVARFDYLTNMRWCTDLGGALQDEYASGLCPGPRIATDIHGNKWVTGTTASGSAGTAPMPYMQHAALYDQPLHGDAASPYVMLDAYCFGFANNDAMVHGTNFGGAGHDLGYTVAVGHDRVYLGGAACVGSNFPLRDPGNPAYFQGYPVVGMNEAFYAQVQVSPLVPVGLEADAEPMAGLQAWPNPATDRVALRWNSLESGAASIVATDLMGKVVRQLDVDVRAGRNEVLLDLSDLPRSLYLVTVYSQEKSMGCKIVRQ